MTAYANPGQFWQRRLAGQLDLVRVGYAGLGRRFNTRMYGARRDALERALAAIGRDFRGARVLDVGCGSGFYTDYCAEQGVADYWGLDIAEVSVATLRARYPDYSFEQVDIARPGLDRPTDRDVVLAADVLFHIVSDAGFAAALRNLAAAVRPGGLLIVSDVCGPRTIQTAAHVRNRSLDEYRGRLEPLGFRVVGVEPIFALLQPPAYDPGAALPWRAYAWFWRYAWRLARTNLADRIVPPVLVALDARLALKRWGRGAPNNKWLLLERTVAGVA